jgi:hypothetical protein
MKPGVIEVVESASKKLRLFVRGGFADVSPTGLTILAEQAIPVEDLNAERIDAEIRNAEEDLSDAQSDESKRVAAEKIAQLRETNRQLRVELALLKSPARIAEATFLHDLRNPPPAQAANPSASPCFASQAVSHATLTYWRTWPASVSIDVPSASPRSSISRTVGGAFLIRAAAARTET